MDRNSYARLFPLQGYEYETSHPVAYRHQLRYENSIPVISRENQERIIGLSRCLHDYHLQALLEGCCKWFDFVEMSTTNIQPTDETRGLAATKIRYTDFPKGALGPI